MQQAAFAAVFKDDKVLLIRSLTNTNYPDHWSFPGGLVDPGETFAQAAVREVWEETGCKCEINRLIAELSNEDEQLEVQIFHATYLSGEFKLQLHEIEDAQWFTIEEALKLPLAYEIERHLLEIA